MSNLDTLQVDDSIQLERQGSILTLWLNRPESRNAMSLQHGQCHSAGLCSYCRR